MCVVAGPFERGEVMYFKGHDLAPEEIAGGTQAPDFEPLEVGVSKLL